MKYFITGATGFIGSALARQLGRAGHEIHAIVRRPDGASQLKEIGAQLFAGDVTDKDSMRPAMQGVDGLFHVAGWYRVGARDKTPGQRVNVEGTRNVLELMRELQIPRGVYTSTLAVNSDTHGRVADEEYRFRGHHLSEYDRSKAEAHEIAAKMISDGLPLIIVMPGLVYGPGDTSSLRNNWIDYLNRRLPMLPGRTAFCWAHVEDVARGHLLAMEKGRLGETYMINGQAATLQQAFQLAEEITGVPAPRLIAPPPLMRGLAAAVGALERILPLPLPETYTAEGLREVAGVTYLGDNGKARRELGYEPRGLREGLEETLRHEMGLLGRV
jgi:nucleoside-diphosphate-sugar epimerase